MDIIIKARHITNERKTIERRVNERNVQSIIDDIDEFILKNAEMKACDIVIIGDGYGMHTVVKVSKKFDRFDLYSFIETQIYHYLY